MFKLNRVFIFLLSSLLLLLGCGKRKEIKEEDKEKNRYTFELMNADTLNKCVTGQLKDTMKIELSNMTVLINVVEQDIERIGAGGQNQDQIAVLKGILDQLKLSKERIMTRQNIKCDVISMIIEKCDTGAKDITERTSLTSLNCSTLRLAKWLTEILKRYKGDEDEIPIRDVESFKNVGQCINLIYFKIH